MSRIYVVNANAHSRECLELSDCLATMAALVGQGFSLTVDVIDVPEREEVSDER